MMLFKVVISNHEIISDIEIFISEYIMENGLCTVQDSYEFKDGNFIIELVSEHDEEKYAFMKLCSNFVDYLECLELKF